MKLRINFVANNSSYKNATKLYSDAWAKYGDKIISVYENLASYNFPNSEITAHIKDERSFSGSIKEKIPMTLRATRPEILIPSELAHEVGHLYLEFTPKFECKDEHEMLFLILGDVFEEVFGKDLAEKRIAFERKLKGWKDYDQLWGEVLALSRDERLAKFKSNLLNKF